MFLGVFWLFHVKNKSVSIIVTIISIIATVYMAVMGINAMISIKKYGDKSKYYPKYMYEDRTGKTWDEIKGDPLSHSTFITIAALNMREKPNLKAKVIYVFKKGEGIIVRSLKGEKGDWLLAETVDLKHKGFVFKEYIRAIDNKMGREVATKHFINIAKETIRGIFSWLGLISLIITVICSIAIYHARGENEKGMELITSITAALCLIISRRMFYGLENLMLMGMEVAIYFFISYFLGFLIWKIVYFILEEYS